MVKIIFKGKTSENGGDTVFQIAKNETMLDDCFEIRKCVFVEEQGVSLENEFDQYEDYSFHIVGYINGVPMATARIRPLNTHVCKIERVAIIKWYHGLGYGKNLIHAIETIAKKHQYNELTMNAQLQARDFYLKLGYSPFGKVFLEENIKHISMNKFL